MRMKDEKKSESLEVPVSIMGWCILKRHICCHADFQVFEKIIRDYINEVPAGEIVDILVQAKLYFRASEHQELVNLIFRY